MIYERGVSSVHSRLREREQVVQGSVVTILQKWILDVTGLAQLIPLRWTFLICFFFLIIARTAVKPVAKKVAKKVAPKKVTKKIAKKAAAPAGAASAAPAAPKRVAKKVAKKPAAKKVTKKVAKKVAKKAATPKKWEIDLNLVLFAFMNFNKTFKQQFALALS